MLRKMVEHADIDDEMAARGKYAFTTGDLDLPCTNCGERMHGCCQICGTPYCSDDCLMDDLSNHKWECGIIISTATTTPAAIVNDAAPAATAADAAPAVDSAAGIQPTRYQTYWWYYWKPEVEAPFYKEAEEEEEESSSEDFSSEESSSSEEDDGSCSFEDEDKARSRSLSPKRKPKVI